MDRRLRGGEGGFEEQPGDSINPLGRFRGTKREEEADLKPRFFLFFSQHRKMLCHRHVALCLKTLLEIFTHSKKKKKYHLNKSVNY